MVRSVWLLVLALSSASPLRAQVGGELRGRVTDALDAHPLVNARIELSGRAEIMRTGTAGTFVLRGLEPQEYTLQVRAVGYGSLTMTVDVTNGRAVDVAIRLQPTATTIADVIVRADGARGARRATSDDVRVATRAAGIGDVVFSRSAIEASGRRDVGELLESVAGAVITRTGGAGSASSISIRGASAKQTLVLLDGVPLDEALTGAVDLSSVSLENVQQVTVRVGAQSARYGPRAMAGVVDIVSRKPARDESVRLTSGAFGDQRASLRLGTTAPAAVAIGIERETARNDFTYEVPAFRGGGVARRDNAATDRTSANVAVAIGGADETDAANASDAKSTIARASSTSARIRASWQEQRRGLAGNIVQPSLSGRENGGRMGASAVVTHARQRYSLTTALDVTRERAMYRDPSPPFSPPFRDSVHVVGTNAIVSATTDWRRMAFAAGVELRMLRVAGSLLAADAPRGQQLSGEWATLHTGGTLQGTRLDVDLSVRADQRALTGANVTMEAAPRAARSAAAISPRAAVRATRGVLATSLSIGAGYAPPTLADQFFQEGVQVRANPALRAERVRQDIEWRTGIDDVRSGPIIVSATAALYRANIDDMILWLPNFRFIWSPANFAVTRRGWEVGGTVRIPAARIELEGSADRTAIEYAGAVLSGQVAYRPRDNARLRIGWAPSFGTERPLHFDVRARRIGARRTVPGSRVNVLEPYTMTDARVSRVFRRQAMQADMSVGVDNVFSERASLLPDYPFPSRAWSVGLRLQHSSVP